MDLKLTDKVAFIAGASRGIGYGIAEALIVWKGYGSRFPTAPNENEDGSDNPEGRSHNRRVEIIIEY